MTRRCDPIPIVTAVLGCLFCGTHVAGDCPSGITPRLPWVKPPSVTSLSDSNRLTIKFLDHLELRAPVDVYGSLGWEGDPDPQPQEVVDALANLNLVTQEFALTYTQVLKLDPGDLAPMEDLARDWSCFAQPDLAGIVIVDVPDPDDLDGAAAGFVALTEVEWVEFTNSEPAEDLDPPLLPLPGGEDCEVICEYSCVPHPSHPSFCDCTGDPSLPCAPLPFDDCCDIAPPTCDFFSQRSSAPGSLILDYHGPDPGIDAICAWAYGARGAGIEIADLEVGFDPGHEDLSGIATPQGQPIRHTWHGTSVLGIMIARDNGYGWIGLSPEADASFFSRSPVVGEAIRRTAFAQAIDHVDPGDVILVEAASKGVLMGQPPTGVSNGLIELDPWFWLLTRLATDSGIVVVSLSGNIGKDIDCADQASCDVDLTSYHARNNYWSPPRDSGAIIVSGGTADVNHDQANGWWGSRINLQGWGRNVFTIGTYGPGATIRFGGEGRQAYQESWGGTSSATPFVASGSGQGFWHQADLRFCQ